MCSEGRRKRCAGVFVLHIFEGAVRRFKSSANKR